MKLINVNERIIKINVCFVTKKICKNENYNWQ